MKTKITYKGDTCFCYGTLEENSNFQLVFEDEYLDDVWVDANTETGEPFKTWREVVRVISEHMGATPEQIEVM